MRRSQILFLCPGVPHPPFHGAPQRNHLLYESLRSVGDVATVVVGHNKPLCEEDLRTLRKTHNLIGVLEPRKLGQTGAFRLLHPLHPRRIEFLARAIGDADREYRPQRHLRETIREIIAREQITLVVGRYAHIIGKTGAADLAPTLLDIDDLQPEMLERSIQHRRTSGIASRLEKRRLRRLRARLPARFEQYAGLWVANPNHRSFPGLERASLLPNVPYTSYTKPDLSPEPSDAASRTLLFVGNLGHNPNLFGLERFIHLSWPVVRNAVPDARLDIVGSGNTEGARRRMGEPAGVHYRGLIEDLDEAYAQAALSIVPIYDGSGTNIKVAESLYHGRATVVTPFALREYAPHLSANESVLVGNSDAELAEACIRLLTDNTLRDSIAATGRETIRTRFSFSVFRERVVAEVQRVLNGATEDTGAAEDQ